MLSQPSRSVLPLIGALFTLYIVWGSTYFVIRLGVAQWPPLMMAGIRFLTAGIVLFSFLAWRATRCRRRSSGWPPASSAFCCWRWATAW